MLSKPSTCNSCPSLLKEGIGYAPAEGSNNKRILLVGEALGQTEARLGKPFQGRAGMVLNRLLNLLGWDRADMLIDNTVRCQPPMNEIGPHLASVDYCSNIHLIESLKNVDVAIAMGATATRTLLDLPLKDHKQENWHGMGLVSKYNTLVVPTFHPAYILRDAHAMIGAVLFDLRVAEECVEHGYGDPIPSKLYIDCSPAWFELWASQMPESAWLAVDIETPEDTEENGDWSYEIKRINFSYRTDEGVTVPFKPEYRETIEKLLASDVPKCLWNERFDIPRLKASGMVINGRILDFMWGWHVYQSDIPPSRNKASGTAKESIAGLGFVAPFFSRYGPWKHLNSTHPGKYAAIDALQTIRVAFGIAKKLEVRGQWEAFWRHVVLLDSQVLHPMEDIGLLVDPDKLQQLETDLTAKKAILADRIKAQAPDTAKPMHPKLGWKKLPTKPPKLKGVEIPLDSIFEHEGKYYTRLDFNSASPTQVSKYLSGKGHNLSDTSALKLERLRSKDPLVADILSMRRIDKVLNTYVLGAKKRLAEDGRLHSQFLHKPSTMRLSSVDPNLQNEDDDFKICIVPADGCIFVEADFSAIEAVITGWLMKDPAYIKLSWASVHAYSVAASLGEAPSLAVIRDMPVEELKHQLLPYKKHPTYDRKKRTIHGVSYGLSPKGLKEYYPSTFKSIKEAQQEYDFTYSLFPGMRKLHNDLRTKARKQHFLGLKDHPYNYCHWFWDVDGADINRVLAYNGQSIAGGVLYESCLQLTDPDNKNYVGDMYYGKTPLRALVHDSILGEVPETTWQTYASRVMAVMTGSIEAMPLPEEWNMGPFLRVGVEIKVGKSWGEMEKI